MLNFVSLSLIFLSVIIIILGIIKVHTYPGKVALARNHPQAKAIEVTSLLGLIIFPFWMFALMWAYSNAIIGKLYTSDAEVNKNQPPPPPPKKMHIPFLGRKKGA